MRSGFFLNVDDFLTSETIATMSNEEIGAYTLLLCWEWKDENCSLPIDDRKLSRLSHMGDSWDDHKNVILANFEKDGNRYVNYRLLFEHDKYNTYIARQKRAGSKSGEARRKRKNNNLSNGGSTKPQPTPQPTTQPQGSNGNGNGNNNNTIPTGIESLASLQTCPHSEIIALYHDILCELPRVRVWTKTREGFLRARWKEDESRQNLEWWRGYFEYIAGCSFLSGKKDWGLNLEWLVRPNNFAKVIEGNYENKKGR